MILIRKIKKELAIHHKFSFSKGDHFIVKNHLLYVIHYQGQSKDFISYYLDHDYNEWCSWDETLYQFKEFLCIHGKDIIMQPSAEQIADHLEIATHHAQRLLTHHIKTNEQK